MGLREIAESDLNTILTDGVYGFGWPLTITDPNGNIASIVGYSNDIGQLIDPDTGETISGRLATVAISIQSLTTAGLSIPKDVTDESLKPWLVSFTDVPGNTYQFKIKKSDPDRTIGVVICLCGDYQ